MKNSWTGNTSPAEAARHQRLCRRQSGHATLPGRRGFVGNLPKASLLTVVGLLLAPACVSRSAQLPTIDKASISFRMIHVEHPVTEAVTGIDIVKEQIKLAAGLPLEYKQSQIKPSGHAIECRINAVDPERFIPSPGKITFLSLPGGPGVRVDTAIYSGYVIPSHYDSLIAKLVVYGKDRSEAIAKMRRSLDEIIIEGINTTTPFHKKVMSNPEFKSGNFNTNFAEKINNNSPENT